MKKAIPGIIITCLACLLAVPARADSTTACAAVLCLAGRLQGAEGGSACTAPVSAYFSIAWYNKYGLLADQTSAARLAWLQSCKEADSSWIERIHAAFGRQG